MSLTGRAEKCGLIHRTELPPNLHFSAENKLGGPKDDFLLPVSLIHGLLVAVLVSPVNAKEPTTIDYMIHSCGRDIPLANMWGQKDKLVKMLS
jgi:hypothetical protein